MLGPIYPDNAPHIKAALRAGSKSIPSPTGAIRHSLATDRPHIVDGKVVGFFVHVSDVSPLKELESELEGAKEKAEDLATHDFLTGLPNRVLLFDRIARALAMAGFSARNLRPDPGRNHDAQASERGLSRRRAVNRRA